MKKNFFKKLSFVMALAMIVSIVAPAAGAFAAEDAHLNATKKYLHLSADTGFNEYDFNIAHKQKGWKYAWTSADEDVATVDAATGLTTATGVGSTKVSVAITKDGEDVATLSADVIVRDNIKTVTVANAPKEALAVNAEYDFNRSFVTVSGSTAATSSVTRWAVDKADTASISASGLFKATAAGDYKVTALAFQSSAKYDEYLVSKDATLVLDTDEVTVTVAPSMLSAKQLSSTKAEIAFDSDMSKVVTKDNLKAYRVIAGVSQPVDLLVKDLKFDATGKTATVEMYIEFAGGENYKFVYGTMEKSFTAAKAEAGNVKSVVLDTKEIVYTNGAKALAVKLYDANGVDITTTALTDRVSYEVTNNVGYYNSTAKSLTLFQKGDRAAVKATFHTYTYDSSYNENVVVGTGEVVAVDAASYSISGTVQWTLSKAAPDWSKATTTVLAAGDSGYSVWARFKSTQSDKDVYYYSYGVSDGDKYVNDNKITFSSSNSDVLIADTYGTVYPAKAGSAVIICYYDGKAVATFPVEVKEARTASVFTLDKNAVTLSNNVTVAATAEVKLSLKDQLGADFTPAGDKLPSFEPLSSNPVLGDGPLSWADGTHMKLNVTAAGATKGTYTYKIKAYDKVQILVVTIQEPTDNNIVYYQLTLDKTLVDTVVNNDGAVKNIAVSLLGFASNGIANFKATWGVNGYTYTVTKDNNAATNGAAVLTDGNIEVAQVNGVKAADVQNVSGAAINVVTGSAIQALDKGTYVVTAYKDGVVKYTASFTVTNSQPSPSYVLEKSETTQKDILKAVRDCVKVSVDGADVADENLYDVEYVFNGTTYTDDANYTAVAAGNYFIKSVQFVKTYSKDGATWAVEYTVNVGRTIVVK
jgi:hypothetical protein